MYNTDDKFLYEILDDYKESISEKEKDDIINAFMKLIWSSKNKRNTYQKGITFIVSNKLLESDIGKIFNNYSNIKYISYKSMSKETDFVNLIRQKVNNIYTNLCDSDVCLKKEYMDLVKLPKQMFYRWKSGETYNLDTLLQQLENIVLQSIEAKEKYAKQKMSIKWNDYKILIVPYFKRMFNNYIPLEKFEDKNYLTLDIDTWNEDNFAVAYLCKGLDGYMRNYQKEYYGIKRNKPISRCKCGGMFIKVKNNKFKCDTCSTYQPQETKTTKCIDCKKDIIIDSKDNETCRCDECKKIYVKERDRLRKQEYRSKMSHSQF